MTVTYWSDLTAENGPQTPRPINECVLRARQRQTVALSFSQLLERVWRYEHPNLGLRRFVMASISFLHNEESFGGSDTVTSDKFCFPKEMRYALR